MIRSKPDEDDYWNSSKYRAFTFDDDDDEFSTLKESKRAVNNIRHLVDDDDDEDDVEKVSWSGERVGSISWSIKETASNVHVAGQDHGFPKINSTPLLPRQGSGYSLSSLFKGRPKSGSIQALSESFPDVPSRSFAPELRKPKAEYKDYSDWSPEETVRRMQRGKAYSLETFRSLKDKMLLLDEAVMANDGNVITAVLIYLKKSLSKEILSRELTSREIALRHYIHYLKEMEEQKSLVELLKSLGRTEDMALLQYKEHLNIKDEVRKKEYLKACIGLPFSPEDASHVQDHYTLLERQIIIEVRLPYLSFCYWRLRNGKSMWLRCGFYFCNCGGCSFIGGTVRDTLPLSLGKANDKQAENKVEVFKKHPRKASILNMPIITTLYYSCFYHYGEPEGTFSSPTNIRSTFKISEKQYFLTVLGARAKLKEWFDVDRLFTAKNWLGYTKKKSPVGFHRVVDILQKNNAPVQVLQEYVSLVEDTEQKISLAQKYKCHDIVIDAYKDLKDRQQLIIYQGKVERNSPEDRKIQDLLNNTQIRWKN